MPDRSAEDHAELARMHAAEAEKSEVDLDGVEALVARSRHTQAELDLVLDELRLRR